LTTLTQPSAAPGVVVVGRPPLVAVEAARLEAVELKAVRGRARVAAVGKVSGACGGVVGATDVATVTRGPDRPAPIALGRISSRPIRLAAQAAT
jgi:hypothetical protein